MNNEKHFAIQAVARFYKVLCWFDSLLSAIISVWIAFIRSLCEAYTRQVDAVTGTFRNVFRPRVRALCDRFRELNSETVAQTGLLRRPLLRVKQAAIEVQLNRMMFQKRAISFSQRATSAVLRWPLSFTEVVNEVRCRYLDARHARVDALLALARTPWPGIVYPGLVALFSSSGVLAQEAIGTLIDEYEELVLREGEEAAGRWARYNAACDLGQKLLGLWKVVRRKDRMAALPLFLSS